MAGMWKIDLFSLCVLGNNIYMQQIWAAEDF